ncbi:LysM peptidoglycan-binding domain-containing protein [Ornithinimicrobium murale]|uniref:LysM peptidoglycan-binding domain-containing protein n=1 Tax=Ornithinimicrobium murale TaxID=1050153 RepID=UPI000E0D3793|nr:LysM domain-containing protein [Ornithinimicrobium murale]
MGTPHDRTTRPPDHRGEGDQVALRAGVLGGLLSAGCALLCLTCGHQAVGLLASGGDSLTSPAHGLELLTLGTAALVAGWLTLLLLVGSIQALPTERLPRVHTFATRCAPHLGPRIAAGLVGSILAVSPGGTALADAPLAPTPTTTQPHAPHGPAATDAHLQATQGTTPAADQPADPSDRRLGPEPGWRPTRSPGTGTTGGTAIELVSRGGAAPDTVVVRSGDTLWDIAARHLGPDADAAQIAQEWPRWHEANRETIGPDPDLLLPGTTLVPPELQGTPTRVSS